MSVSLRLSRGGSKKRPFFRIVAADIRSPRDGKYLERLGTYNPMKTKEDPERIMLNIERIKYWLSVGAKPTERVTKFLAKEGLSEKPSIPKQTKQDKPRKKTLEKLKAKEEKLKAKEEMEKAVKEEKSGAPEATSQTAEAKPTEPEAKPEATSQTAEAKPAEPEAKPEATSQAAEAKPAEPEAKPEATSQAAEVKPEK